MPKFNVLHVTSYHYPTPVTDSANKIVLYPQTTDYQEVLNHKITLSPNAHIDTFIDYFGNKVGVFTLIEPHSFLVIKSEFEVITKEIKLPLLSISAEEEWSEIEKLSNQFPYLDYVQCEQFKSLEEISALVHNLKKPGLTVMEVTTLLSSYIYENFVYEQGVTDYETEIDEIWDLKKGVCQDFAHLLLVFLRILRIPARYISGYISPVNEEMRGEGATHAWVEVFIPTFGWLGNDPTNNCWVSDRHIRLAFGRNFKDITPIKGTYKGTSHHTLGVTVFITSENTKETQLPEKPAYIRQAPVVETQVKPNSYHMFLERQQQQQQQQ